MTAPQQPQERRAVRYDELELHVDPEPVSRIRRCRHCPEILVGPRGRRTGICDDCIGRGGSPVIWIGLLLAAIAAGAVVALFMLAAATPRSGSADLTRPALTGAPPSSSGSDGSGASAPSAGASPRPSPLADGGAPQTQLGTALVAGWATWYDDGPGFYGAVPSWSFGDDPYGVQVCLLDRPATCTHVVVRDFCACGDRHDDPTVIDLSPSAFRELAPLSRGVIRVTVEGPIDIPLPPTDLED